MDYLNNKLAIGDSVVYCDSGYSHLRLGSVIKITPCGATLEYGTAGKTINRQKAQMMKVGG